MGSYSNMWWSVARRSLAVPLCRLQSLLSSNSKTTSSSWQLVATAMPRRLLTLASIYPDSLQDSPTDRF